MNSEHACSGLVRRGLVLLLTALGYLLGLALGVLALMALVRIVEFGGALLILQYGLVEPRYARGTLTVLRNVTTIGGGLLLLAAAVFGLDTHFRHAGRWRSLRLLALTIGSELALLALERLVVY